MRLLLLRSWAKEMARTAGINPLCCMTSGTAAAAQMLPATSSRITSHSDGLNETASYDAASNICQALTSGVLNFSRTALAVRCPGIPVLLTTMYSKLAGDWGRACHVVPASSLTRRVKR